MSDTACDVAVVGSGAAGMACALTAAAAGLDVLVVEKTAHFGGSTAISGGAVWIPGNSHMAGVGHADSREAVTAYLSRILGNRLRPDMLGAFLDQGPEMVRFLETHTEVRFAARAHSPDYRPELEGASLGGRTLDPLPYDGRELGAAFADLRPPIPQFLAFGGMMVNRTDIAHLLGAARSWTSFRETLRLLGRYAADRLSHPRGTRLLMGNALAARLLKSALDRGIRLEKRTAVTGLVIEQGRVVGIDTDGPLGRVTARRAVVLATGGFPANAEMRADLMPHAAQHVSMAPADNAGDGIRLAISAGGRLDTDTEGNAFWAPVSVLRRPDGSLVPFPHLILDRQKPGLIAVDASGRRFTNEAQSYHDFVTAMHRTPGAIPAFLICDRRFLRRYGLGLVRPGPRRLRPFLDAGYLVDGDTVAALAHGLGLDPSSLAATVTRFNEQARAGRDSDFGKGDGAYDRYLGDAAHGPNPCLAPIEDPPFYAVRVFPGDIGTACGIRVDPQARVLNAQDRPIPGLHACGNDMASIMAGSYPAAGITLGPGLTFGYIAGKTIAAG